MAALTLVGCGSDSDPAPTTPVTTRPTSGPTPSLVSTVSPPAAWRQIATTGARPGPRRDPSLTAAGPDALLAFGGRTNGISNAELWRFDIVSAAWNQIEAAGPGARFAHNAFYDAGRGRFIVTLGESDSGFYNDVWAFDLSSQAWSQLDAASAEHPKIRYGAGGAYDIADDRILVSHGFTDVGRFDDTWQFDFKTNEWSQIVTSGPLPIKRCLVRTVWDPAAQRMLLFGGQTDENPFLGDFWSLDPLAGIWTEDPSLSKPGPRNLYGAALDAASERWLVIGGNTADGPIGEAWAYDLAGGTWSQIEIAADLPGRYSLDAALLGSTVYAFGGNDGKGDLDELWALEVRR